MRTILVLMDTLKRDMLTVYNKDTFVKSPNITKFAEEATVFDNHFIGSAPCMPARRDILCGRLNFLERSWGPIEPFDITLPKVLKDHGVYTHITTDHCHYFRTGGEGYVQSFNTWDYHRGQEGDPWISRIDDPSLPNDYYGRVRRQYQLNRTMWPNEEQYPSPKTFASACEWLENNKDANDFFLMVEAFDPHEPFDVCDKYMEMYGNPQLDKEYFEIPNYGHTDVPQTAVDYIQKRYAALLSMSDHWFGKLIAKIKALNIYDDTLIIMTTDHGYFLGEHDYLGKNIMHLYNELAHLPLIIHFPKNQMVGQRVDKITQNIDLMPTILAYNEIAIPASVKGESLKKIVDGQNYDKAYALYGYHGMAMNITDGRYTLFKAPNQDNKPCFEYTCIPTTIRKFLGTGIEETIEMGRFIARTNYPVYKIPVLAPSIIDNVKGGLKEVSEDKLFDLTNDYAQVNNIYDIDQANTQRLKALMVEALAKHEAPSEQLDRLNLR
ncbi:MAG: sulfatase-like hydrolase/transferase [Erysipelotrichaceae bacterium]|nr:sulfatase-like hydrolase/transferase [Erysipelotrichaceae bacterium]MDY5252122.1 sulfatase-like hydrolase/transferase [Erysipelotrichaceae bacterium]